ncbi:hypothetical protein CORC01_08105 [Colletotrichum orchidophilum]|uniref:Uncharacterized protein n=1 Tax=Colletotrichum orchidophilum TaxID=1209926 RepID=A0A1G4B5C8_9PEZI|nr:uncharacterized protein CORC01_08105 [Colletotrichum orchidophilum]OHE96648.1 hypothetical protein CORC01_08105 [Colletotrichum orchidophilum]
MRRRPKPGGPQMPACLRPYRQGLVERNLHLQRRQFPILPGGACCWRPIPCTGPLDCQDCQRGTQCSLLDEGSLGRFASCLVPESEFGCTSIVGSSIAHRGIPIAMPMAHCTKAPLHSSQVKSGALWRLRMCPAHVDIAKTRLCHHGATEVVLGTLQPVVALPWYGPCCNAAAISHGASTVIYVSSGLATACQ